MRRVTIGGFPPERIGAMAALAVAAGVLVWLMFYVLPSRFGGDDEPAPTSAGAAVSPQAPVIDQDARKIKTRIFYVAESGTRLVPLEQDVPLADDPVEQAKEIVRMQVAAVEPPLVTAIPAGTSLDRW